MEVRIFKIKTKTFHSVWWNWYLNIKYRIQISVSLFQFYLLLSLKHWNSFSSSMPLWAFSVCKNLVWADDYSKFQFQNISRIKQQATVGTKIIRIQNQNGRMCPNFIFWYSYLLYFNIEIHIIKYNLDFQMKNDFKLA